MKAYWQAILEVTGMLAGEAFDVNLFMGNYRTHIDSGRLIPSVGGLMLSSEGREYFCQRIAKSQVSRQEVVEMIRLITANKPAIEWKRIR